MSNTNLINISIENPELSESFVERINKNTVGITVVHLQSHYKEQGEDSIKRHSSLDYHLHFLKYKIGTTIGVLCLDTSDFLDCNEITFGTNTYNFLMTELTKTFIDNIFTVTSNPDLPKSIAFNKAPSKLWEKFNELKEDSFIQNTRRFAKYLNTDNDTSLSNRDTPQIIKQEPDTHKGFQINYNESRVILAS